MDTIAATSTAPGIGAIAMIRMSGDNALNYIQNTFSSKDKKLKPRHVYYGNFNDKNKLIDHVLVTYFQSPASYTGEDLIEITCHGGRIVIQQILQALFDQGARPAEAGEFTQRAFLNGKMDLLQAQGVEDIIKAESDQALKAAHSLLDGKLSHKIDILKNNLIHIISGLEAEIEFPDEEDIQENLESRIQTPRFQELLQIKNNLQQLVDSFEQGILMRQGFSIALLGAPNTGKSTLMNSLIGFERSIVSKYSGTTRDYIQEKFYLKGLPIQITDLAGIRKNALEIESMGIDRSIDLLKKTNLALFLVDQTREVNEDDLLALNSCPKNIDKIFILNKCDEQSHIQNTADKFGKQIFVEISALNGRGLEKLKNIISSKIEDKLPQNKEDLVLTHITHQNAIKKSKDIIENNLKLLSTQLEYDPELISYDLRVALRELQVLTGEVTVDDIMNHIFANFCIGK